MSDLNAVATELRDNMANLETKDVGFAASLLDQLDSKGNLSVKQAYWVGVLKDRAIKKEDEYHRPETVKNDLGTFAGIFEMFAVAKEHLKFPKIRLQLESGHDVCLAVAGSRSKYAGQIMVSDGRPYGCNRWYGRVDQDGVFTRAYKKFDEDADVLVLLEKLAKNPAETAAEYGRMTGKCCFCNHGLKDERSTEVGYGPVCADHYALPWG